MAPEANIKNEVPKNLDLYKVIHELESDSEDTVDSVNKTGIKEPEIVDPKTSDSAIDIVNFNHFDNIHTAGLKEPEQSTDFLEEIKPYNINNLELVYNCKVNSKADVCLTDEDIKVLSCNSTEKSSHKACNIVEKKAKLCNIDSRAKVESCTALSSPKEITTIANSKTINISDNIEPVEVNQSPDTVVIVEFISSAERIDLNKSSNIETSMDSAKEPKVDLKLPTNEVSNDNYYLVIIYFRN